MGVFKSIGKAAGGRIKQNINLVERAFISRPSHMGVFSSSQFEVFASSEQLDTIAAEIGMSSNVKDLLNGLLDDALKGGTDAVFNSPPVTVIGFPRLNVQNNYLSSTKLVQVSLSDVQSGLLSQVVVYFDDAGVRGLQQYFGSAPGTYLGCPGNMQEASFPIPYNDPLVRILTLYSYSEKTPHLRAVRFVTAGGQDSGWLGQDVSGQHSSYYVNVNEYRVEDSGGWIAYPIYAIDAFENKPGAPSHPQALLTRHCPPFDVLLDILEEQSAGSQTTTETPDGALDLQWDYDNRLDEMQTVQVRERITLANSHTITITKQGSVSRSFGVSLSGKMLMEGGYMSASASASESSSIVTSQSDSTSITQTEEREIDFPLSIPANTRIRATLHSSHTTETADGRVRIQYKGRMSTGTGETAPWSTDNEAAMEFPVTLFGVNTLQNTVTVEPISE